MPPCLRAQPLERAFAVLLKATAGLALVAQAVSAQHFGNSSTVEVCSHTNKNCRPVTSGEMFAAVSFFTFWPWVILYAVLIYLTFGCISCGDVVESCCQATGRVRRRPSARPSTRDDKPAVEMVHSKPRSPAAAAAADVSADKTNPVVPGPAAAAAARADSAAKAAATTSAPEAVPDPLSSRSGAVQSPLEPAAMRSFTMARSGMQAEPGSEPSLESVVRILSGTATIEGGLKLRATSKLASVALRLPVASDMRSCFEVKLPAGAPTGIIRLGIVSTVMPLNESMGQGIGQSDGSWAMSLADGAVFAESLIDGKGELHEAWTPITGGETIGVVIDRPSTKMAIYRNGALAHEIFITPEDKTRVLPAISLSGSSCVHLCLGNGWGKVSEALLALAEPIGAHLGKAASE